MDKWTKARELCEKGNVDFDTAFRNYSAHGYVYATPDTLLMFEHVVGAAPVGFEEEIDLWYIFLAIGEKSLSSFYSKMPYHLPYLGFNRTRWRGVTNLKIYDTTKFGKKLYGTNSNGGSDDRDSPIVSRISTI